MAGTGQQAKERARSLEALLHNQGTRESRIK